MPGQVWSKLLLVSQGCGTLAFYTELVFWVFVCVGAIREVGHPTRAGSRLVN